MDEIEPAAATAEPEVEYPALCLRKGEDARLRAGHLWVFSNEVDVQRSPLDRLPARASRRWCVDHAGKPIGIGYVNPNALICARLVTRGLRHPLDRSLIVHRLNVALALRERCTSEPYYRLVFGESDGLPGLVLDRFGDVIVGQIAHRRHGAPRGAITDAVVKVLKPAALVWKNDGSARAAGEPARIRRGRHRRAAGVGDGARGRAATSMSTRSAGRRPAGSTTSAAIAIASRACVRGKRVLDSSATSVPGACAPRRSARAKCICVDVIAAAVAAITRNAERNGMSDRVHGDRSRRLRSS